MLQIIWAICLLVGPADMVKNGETAKGKSVTLEFEQNLRLGPKGDQEHLLWTGSIVTMVANSLGHLFVLDGGGLRVLHFDEDGEFVQQIGNRGNGPGEFQRLTNLSVLRDDRLVVSEYRLGQNVVSFFDANGRYLDRTSSNNPVRMFSAQYTPDGKHIGSSYFTKNEQGGLKVTFGILSKDRVEKLGLTHYKLPDLDGSLSAEWWAGFLAPWFQIQPNQGLVSIAADGSIYTASSAKYEITRYTPELKKSLVFSRKYKPRAITEEQQMLLLEPIHEQVLSAVPPQLKTMVTSAVIQKAVKKAELPLVTSPIVGLAPMEEGGLLVIHSYNPVTYKSEADLFNKQGKLIGSAKLPPIEVNIFGGFFGFTAKMWFKNGQAYTIESEDENYYLSRYSYKIVPE